MTNYDETLQEAWNNFCDSLKQSGELVFRDSTPTTPLDRATGIQYLARYVSKALNEKFEFNDPLYPHLWQLETPISKSFGDNPDCNYLSAVIDAQYTYRIVGNRGSSHWVSFCCHEPDYGPVIACLNNDRLQTNWDGSFEIFLSQKRHPGNWLQTTSGRHWLFIREYFGEWDKEVPMSIRIERVGTSTPPPPLSPEQVAHGLKEASQWLRADSLRWVERYTENFRKEKHNQFFVRKTAYTGSGAEEETGRALQFCYWEVQPDEALIIKVVPPKAAFWNLELNNYFRVSMDYRYRLSSLNGVQANYEDDGSVLVILSHRDPGIPNWLDASGHTCGTINQRWVDADARPVPQTELIKFADLSNKLPPNCRHIDAVQRQEQLKRRKIGVDRRFKV